MALAGTDQVTLTFEQYGALFNDGQKVYVSTDGTVGQKFSLIMIVHRLLVTTLLPYYGNPETATANIASAISAITVVTRHKFGFVLNGLHVFQWSTLQMSMDNFRMVH